MNAPDKKAALAHYEGQAAIAELALLRGEFPELFEVSS